MTRPFNCPTIHSRTWMGRFPKRGRDSHSSTNSISRADLIFPILNLSIQHVFGFLLTWWWIVTERRLLLPVTYRCNSIWSLELSFTMWKAFSMDPSRRGWWCTEWATDSSWRWMGFISEIDCSFVGYVIHGWSIDVIECETTITYDD